MANEQQPPKKPNQPPVGKPVTPPPSGKPAAGSGKPAPGGKPPVGKPAGKAAGKPAGAKGNGKTGDGKKIPPAPKPIRAKEAARMGGRRFGQVLIDLGFVDEEQLWDVLEEAKATGTLTGQVALARGLITEDQLLSALADQHGLKTANLEEFKPQNEAITLVPETMATVYKILPISHRDGILTVALSDPSNMAALDDLRNFLGVKEVIAQLSTAKAIADATVKCYAGKEESIVDIINQLESDPDLGGRRNESSIDLESLMEIQDAAPVRKLINMVFLLAIRDHASDIHFEPFEDEYKMRYRCDGTLYEMVPPPRHLAMAISSRIKVMSNLDIAERRLPQDGRIELNVGGNPVDMRVSVLPTMFGESVVIRVLDRTVVSLDLNKVGMDQGILGLFRQLIHKPNGIVLVTGPTGAGKTTTLYSALNELNEITDKIITTEDPVEYDIEGIIQCQINHEIGLTFASALRSLLP